MANNNSTHVGGGIGFAGALTILFIALKLIGIIEWSWVWVLAPIWISWAIALVLLIIFAVVKVLADR